MSDIDAIRKRCAAAEADSAAWWQIVADLDLLGCLDCSNNACDRARDALGAPHPGAALLAELDAARDENAFLREWLRGELTLADADIDQALAKASAL